MGRLGLIQPSRYCKNSFFKMIFYMKPARSLMLKLVILYNIIKMQAVIIDSASWGIILLSSPWLSMRSLKDWEF